jgi:hypothetical protein
VKTLGKETDRLLSTSWFDFTPDTTLLDLDDY